MMNTLTDHSNIDELIAGYLAQQLSQQELNDLRTWLRASDENKAYFIKMQELWFSAVGADNRLRYDKEKAFQRFLARTTLNAVSIQKSKHLFLSSFQRIAAAVVFLILFAGSIYWLGNRHFNQQFADVYIEAPLGSRTKLYLPDGSLVWLNAGSSISYSQNFGISKRNVTLEGEGYFEVTKNKSKPFTVKTSDLSVSVLGTKFNFRNYQDEEEAKVTLIEGKVCLNSGSENKDQHYLSPNQQAVFDKKLKTTIISATKANNSSEWTQGLIFFDEEQLTDIVKELERSYNVKITITDDSLRHYRFYGNFTRTEQTIQEVLDILASTNKLNYKIQGKEVTLSLK